MENKARYTIVGLFIVVFAVSLVVFILWQARYNFEKAQPKEYRLYSKNSIAGLNIKSFVEYKGLNIGVVEDIRIDPNNLEQIEIILKITQPQIIKTNSYAIVQSQGITGNKTIEIDGGTVGAKELKREHNGYGIIPLKQSFLDSLTSNAKNITIRVEDMLIKIDKLLSQKNIDSIGSSLSNIDKSSKNFNDTLIKVNHLLDGTLNNSLNQFNSILKSDVPKTFENIDNLTKQYGDISKKIQKLIENDITHLVNNANDTVQSTQNIGEVVSKLEETLQKVDTTLDTLNENGGNMIFKTREVNYGPQEVNNEN